MKNPHGAGIAGYKRVGDRLYTEEKAIGMNSNRVWDELKQSKKTGGFN